ncbi:HmuY family protein [Flavobacterium procerum]|uniref:HmuY family protein n=1 Tax=Flavobacterium procerum TaxID=1455569 RepID=A0ABV6BKD4_9FLAO
MKKLLLLSFAFLSLTACSSDDDTPEVEIPTVGAVLQPTVGGPNQPNQVYLDLSTEESKSINRSSWDFGFSSSSDFRVVINGSLKMAIKKLATSDITVSQEIDNTVNVGFDTAASLGYVDNPTGILAGAGAGVGTAIAEISATDADNKVYLVNLGFDISTTKPSTGSASVDGTARGWKKVRILRSGNGYKIQYADLTSATFTEKTVSKDAAYNFTFFSLTTGNTVSVEPEKAKWDLNFTTFTNYTPYQGQDVTYGYADFITTNVKAGTQVYQVLVADGVSYADFTKAKIVETNFTTSSTDQRIIGANWRNGGGPGTLPSIRTDRFYVVKDVAGNYYKVKFLALTNDAGERGYPSLEYAILK